ncbi:hypothetical protein BJX61DRAFT_547322 [Aspergillus egyptiacus]|nr:hypothetical protein BJX61DRAFT_547322 [Aspergillus egyptiacus]
MDGPPPPPPPHGEKPQTTHGEYRKSSDLPQGNYDIFVIPPHSAGSGFLYLPSLRCQRNSFLAGTACTLVAVYVWSTITPMLKLWYLATIASGDGNGIAALAMAVATGVAGWMFGNYQAGKYSPSRPGRPRFGSWRNWFGSGGPDASNADGKPNGGSNYARGAGFGAQSGGPHQQGNYGENFAGGPPPGNQYSGNQYRANSDPPPQTTPGPNPNAGPNPGPSPGPNRGDNAGTHAGGPNAKPTGPGPQADNKPQTAEDQEKAKEEARRKEELRRKMEEFRRKREAEARERERQHERERMEKELRERREQLEREMAAAREAAAREARLQAEKEAAEHRVRLEREAAEARQREVEARERAERVAEEARVKAEREAAEARARAERLEAEAKARAEREAAEKEAAAKAAAKREADAKFAALKEAAARKYAEKKARDAEEAAKAKKNQAEAATASNISSASAPPPRSPSPKKPAASQSNTSAPAAAVEEETYSFQPYDRPRRPYASTTQSSTYSESSYAPSQSTARTTPPPSYRGRYETKDPDKIVIRGVYTFDQSMPRTPMAELVSGQGMVTDGLVLRITTEGLFIDDDVRGVPQREWDVKAWTMKLVEVWCPKVGAPKPNAPKANQAFFRRPNDAPSAEESEAYLANFLKVCKNTCRLASPDFSSRHNPDGTDTSPCGGLHILRATTRGQEGRRYIFVLQETEGWKVALGLQHLQKSTQVRALGVCGMTLAETRSVLSGLGY